MAQATGNIFKLLNQSQMGQDINAHHIKLIFINIHQMI
ncbi:hypothetical protein IHI24_000795 [Rickettsia endosymbiont of Cardiosporidium cionae]|nr:hypothetical protein IHI24_000795 [Rickettsia endosymbiont of Cardiosporidium cionae]